MMQDGDHRTVSGGASSERAPRRWDAFSPTLKQEVAQSFAHEAVNHSRSMTGHLNTVNTLIGRLKETGVDDALVSELEDTIVQIQSNSVDIAALVASTTGQRVDFDRIYADVVAQSGVDATTDGL